jgi:hypothetical protein
VRTRRRHRVTRACAADVPCARHRYHHVARSTSAARARGARVPSNHNNIYNGVAPSASRSRRTTRDDRYARNALTYGFSVWNVGAKYRFLHVRRRLHTRGEIQWRIRCFSWSRKPPRIRHWRDCFQRRRIRARLVRAKSRGGHRVYMISKHRRSV